MSCSVLLIRSSMAGLLPLDSKRWKTDAIFALTVMAMILSNIMHITLFQWSVFASQFKKQVCPLRLSRFLGLDSSDQDEQVFLACHMYAVKKAVESNRHLEQHQIYDDLASIIWQGHKTVSLNHPGLLKR